MGWYSGIGLFRHIRPGTTFVPQYEERVVVVRSVNAAKAKKKILGEFEEYAQDGIEFLGEYEISDIDGEPGLKPIEVSSMMRVSDGEPEEYLTKVWGDLRPASCDDVGWVHCWYQKTSQTLGCYNCLTARRGRLDRKTV